MNPPSSPSRRSIRLPGFDYSQSGLYYVTVVTANRTCLFGHVENGHVILSSLGLEVEAAWLDLPNHYQGVESIDWVVMPNHFHGLVWLHTDLPDGEDGRVSAPLPRRSDPPLHDLPKREASIRGVSLSEIVRAFKSFSSRRINNIRSAPGCPVWQRGYYERIIRSDDDGQRIIEYIQANPFQWDTDEENPASLASKGLLP